MLTALVLVALAASVVAAVLMVLNHSQQKHNDPHWQQMVEAQRQLDMAIAAPAGPPPSGLESRTMLTNAGVVRVYSDGRMERVA